MAVVFKILFWVGVFAGCGKVKIVPGGSIREERVSVSEILTPLVFQLGAGGIAGFVVGYALKKLAKIVAFILGLFFIALLYLGYTGIINVNYGKLIEAIEGLMRSVAGASSWITAVIAVLPFAATFAVGFGLGLKVG